MTVRSSLYYRRGAGGKVAIEDMSQSTGKRLFVHSGTGTDGTAYGFTPDKPYATLDYAIGKCTEDKGDIIYLMPGHAESIASATGAAMDVAGVQVIGLGHGSLQPTFTLGTATTATIAVTAANCRIKNIKVVSNIADCAAGITASADADGLIVEDCLFVDGGLTKELVIGIQLAAACDNCVIRRCRFFSNESAQTGGDASAIKLVGESANTRILDNVAYGNYSVACIDASTAAVTNLWVMGNTMVNTDTDGGLAYSGHASTIGVLAYNAFFGTKATTHPIAGINACYLAQNFANDAVATSGILDPTAGTFGS